MADTVATTTENAEDNVTIEIEKNSTVPKSEPNTDDFDIENEVKKINWEEEDIVLAEKDNKTTKEEYYLRSDVTVGGKIVEDAIEDSTHPYDTKNFFIRWFYKITYAYL